MVMMKFLVLNLGIEQMIY